MQLLITGAPRTKKTSNQIVHLGKKCPTCRRGSIGRVFPSETWRKWVRDAVVFENRAGAWRPWDATRILPERPYSCAALFYRDKAAGDAVGYYQGLADLLQDRGVLHNDVWIVKWDGSELAKDAATPRVELVLSPVIPLALG